MNRPAHLIFLHMPKTAGSTLTRIMHRQYRADEMYGIYQVRKYPQFTALPEEQRAKIKLLKGHIPFGLHAFLPNGKTEYFTILREPVDRVVSHYYHFARQHTDPFYKEFHEKKYTIRGLVESGRILNMENCMVRFLSGEFDRGYGRCDEAMLEKAIKNLEQHFPIVGLNPQFDIFLLRLCERYGWRFPYYRRKRVGHNRTSVKTLDAETLDAIKKYNTLDIELYAHMKVRIEKEQEALPEAFYRRLRRFQRTNQFLQKAVSLILK